MTKRKTTLAEALRRAAKDSGLTAYRLAKDSGVDSAAVLRFLHQQRGLTLESAGKLAQLLGLELRPIRKAGD